MQAGPGGQVGRAETNRAVRNPGRIADLDYDYAEEERYRSPTPTG